LIFSDVLLRILHTLLRKKLFLVVTGGSAGLGIDDHLFRHSFLLWPYDWGYPTSRNTIE
jgi:hypothetical protein